MLGTPCPIELAANAATIPPSYVFFASGPTFQSIIVKLESGCGIGELYFNLMSLLRHSGHAAR